MLRILAVTAFFLSLLMASTVAMAAQDDAVAEIEPPDPALCTLQPRTIEELQQLVASRGPEPQASPTPLPDPFEMPEGFSLFEDERAEVEKDLLRAVSCFNTGDPLKVFATYTDAYVLKLIDQLGGLDEEVEAVLSTVRPLEPKEYIVILSIEDPVLINDGRVVVVVSGDDPADDNPPGPRLFYLEEVLPGRWLIDDVIEVELE